VNRLKHAFALDSPDFEPTDAQKEVVDRVCREIVRRGMATPALIFLEMFRPLNYIGSQVMHFFRPIVAIVLDVEGYRHMSEFLEHRQSVDHLRQRIEELDDSRLNFEDERKEAEAGQGKSKDSSP